MRVRRALLTGIALGVAAAGAAHAEGGMPQLDFKSPLLLSQVVWGAIIFAGLYIALSRYFLPPVGQVIAARQEAIGADLERARLAKQDADQAVRELRTARQQSIAQAQARIAEATRRAKDEAAARAAALNERLDAQLAESEAAIARARRAALGSLAEVATDTAGAVIARLTGHAAEGGRVRGAVGAVIAERGLQG